MRSRIWPVRTPIITISRSATTVRPIVAPMSAVASDGGGVDRGGHGEGDGVGRAQRLEEAAGLDGAGDVGGDLVVVSGDDETGAGDRCERRLPGPGDAEAWFAGQERAVDAEELEGVGPPRRRVQVAETGAPGEAHLGLLVTAQRVDDPLGDVEPADPVAAAQQLGQLEDRGHRVEADAGAGHQIGELLGDQLDVATLVVPGDDRRGRLAVPIEEHPGLADAGDTEADDAVTAAALLDGPPAITVRTVSTRTSASISTRVTVDHPRRRRGRGGAARRRRGRRRRP